MRVEKSIAIDASRDEIWAQVADPCRYPKFMKSITRLEQRDDGARRGVGARYSTRMRVGSADVGGIVEIVEFDEPADLAWTSVTGHRPAPALAPARGERRSHDRHAEAGLRRSRRAARPGLGADLQTDGGKGSGREPSHSQAGHRRTGRRDERTEQEHSRASGVQRGQRQGAGRRRRDPADAARPPGARGADAGALGSQPGGGRDLARRALPERHGHRRRARHADLRRAPHAHERAGPRPLGHGHRRGRPGGGDVPKSPRLHRGHGGGVQARRRTRSISTPPSRLPS